MASPTKKFSHDLASHEIQEVLGQNKTMKTTIDLAIQRANNIAQNSDNTVMISAEELKRREANKEASDTLQEMDNNVRILAKPLIHQTPSIAPTISGPGGSRTSRSDETED